MSEQDKKLVNLTMTRGELAVVVEVLGALSPIMDSFGGEAEQKIISGIRDKLDKTLGPN